MIVIRDGVPTDWNWLRTWFWIAYHPSPHGRSTPREILVGKLETLLTSPDWRLRVCCPNEVDDEILGALLHRPGSPVPTVGWLATEEVHRRHGVARALLHDAGISAGEVHCAFLDPDTAKLAALKGYRLRFRPYLPDVAAWDMARLNRGAAE